MNYWLGAVLIIGGIVGLVVGAVLVLRLIVQIVFGLLGK